MSVFVKICGICSGEQARAVASCGPDAMGFVFWPQSKRCVDPQEVGVWTRDLPAGILKVGVFVDMPREEVLDVVESAGLDVIQLHGKGSAGGYAGLGLKLWKVVHLDREQEQDAEAQHVDAFLVDSYSTESPGGTGRTCDWQRARGFVESCGRPVILAGGLTPGNVEEALRRVGPWGVDVSTGVEESPGVKDLDLVRSFISGCRAS